MFSFLRRRSKVSIKIEDLPRLYTREEVLQIMDLLRGAAFDDDLIQSWEITGEDVMKIEVTLDFGKTEMLLHFYKAEVPQ